MFVDAGLDTELSDALFAVDSDPTYNYFAADAAATLTNLFEEGYKIGVLSNIHFDIRPFFAEAGLSDLIETFVLSNEHGIQKPDPAIFRLTCGRLGTRPEETLMVGDRPSRDGAAVEVGMPTLLVPSLTDPQRRQLHLVGNALGINHVAGEFDVPGSEGFADIAERRTTRPTSARNTARGVHPPRGRRHGRMIG